MAALETKLELARQEHASAVSSAQAAALAAALETARVDTQRAVELAAAEAARRAAEQASAVASAQQEAAVAAAVAAARIRRAKWVSQASCIRSLEVQKDATSTVTENCKLESSFFLDFGFLTATQGRQRSTQHSRSVHVRRILERPAC
jgi:hypothetical protein